MEKNFEDLKTGEIATMDDEQLREYASPEWPIDELRAQRDKCREIIASLNSP